eukprot:SAG31_NODE_3090_length_4687_cov_4.344377_2_plen_242_part_00
MQIAVTELLMTETMTAMGMPDEGKHFNYALFGTFGLCCLLAGPGLPNIGALSSSPYALYSVATGLLFGLNMLFNQDELLAQYKFQGKRCYFLVFVQLFDRCGTLIERNTALIEKVSALIADGSADYKYWVTIIMYGIGTCLLVLVLQCLALSGSDRMTKMGFIRIGWCMSMCIMVCSALQKTFNAQAGLMQDNMVEFTIGPVDVALKGPDVNVILQFTGGLLAYREMVAGDKAELEKLKKN